MLEAKAAVMPTGEFIAKFYAPAITELATEQSAISRQAETQCCA
jgi:hypothetical protein